MPNSCILYARRSSDADDHQVLSIESQLEELRALAAERGLEISREFTESHYARAPGRPVFNDLMKHVREKGDQTILVWSLDRLARNMVDGGVIIYELTEAGSSRS